MPGNTHRFTLKEDKLANRITEEYIEKGYSPERARAIGYATVNKIIHVPGNIKSIKVTVRRKSFRI